MESAFLRRVAAIVLTALAVSGMASRADAASGSSVTVAADGSGDFTSVQAAVDAVPPGNATRFTIKIKPGRYAGQVIVPSDKRLVAFVGLGATPADVVIEDNRANGTPRPGGGTWGTTGSASVTVSGDDFLARNLTFANTFDEAANPQITGRQAVAVLTNADRAVYDRVRFLGNQDTLYVNSRAADLVARAYFKQCYVEGDVDFIFGRGTAVFDRCEIRSLTRGSDTNNGYVTAPSTSIANPHGFLFMLCTLTSDAPAGTVYLGRPWHPSNDPNAIGSVVFRKSTMGAHIKAAPWSDFGTWPWREARFFEYGSKGPGAAGDVADRPQQTAEQYAATGPKAWLAGTDGWDPV